MVRLKMKAYIVLLEVGVQIHLHTQIASPGNVMI